MRRLGRDWQYPEERPFVMDYILGLVPDCVDCGRVIPVRIDRLSEPYLCDYCDDRRDLDARNRDHDIVLVEEEYGYAFWAWYPEPEGMSDQQLEHFWRTIPRFRCTDDLETMLGGEWYSMTQAGFDGHRLDRDNHSDLRYAHVHEDEDSFLRLPTKPLPGTDGWREYREHFVYHRGHPKRKRRRKTA
jgi:hypothetical protein